MTFQFNPLDVLMRNMLLEFHVQAEQTCQDGIVKTAGSLLYTIAAKLKAQIAQHRGLLTKYVSHKKITSDLQLTGTTQFLYISKLSLCVTSR